MELLFRRCCHVIFGHLNYVSEGGTLGDSLNFSEKLYSRANFNSTAPLTEKMLYGLDIADIFNTGTVSRLYDLDGCD
jgi:hypothetical protein